MREADDASETPLGDWQTEGKGSVRIEQCGRALCGHVLNPSSTDNGELVLINMKPKEAALWSGKIYSHDSENTYYATIAMKRAGFPLGQSLRVRQVLLFRQSLEPDRRQAREAGDLAADLAGAAVVAPRMVSAHENARLLESSNRRAP